MSAVERHGGNREAWALELGCRPEQLLDASASLVPFGPPRWLQRALRRQLATHALSAYPDRRYSRLRQAIAAWHGLDPDQVMPGNGAAELFTWAARDAASCGSSLVPQPGFADYGRALATWQASVHTPPLVWQPGSSAAQPFLCPAISPSAQVLWITNPHNPTAQLWSRASLEPLLARFALVIADEAFLPLVPGGEAESLIPLLAQHPNLVVIRSLTKLLAVAGLRLGYALAAPERLAAWGQWRDPWPVNGLAAAAGSLWFEQPQRAHAWQQRVHRWVASEGAWLQEQLSGIDGLSPVPSAANYLLLRGERDGRSLSLQPLLHQLAAQEQILLRDCRSFAGLGESWLRIAYQDRRGNRRIVGAMRRSMPQALSSINTSASS